MGSVFTFMGADHRCGTSMISLCAAEHISKQKADWNILLIHSEAKSGDEYTPRLSANMELISPYISEELIDADEIKAKSKYKNNLYIIGGANDPLSSSKYNPDKFSIFLESCSENFDLIICDAGSEIEHGLAVGAIVSAKRMYVVAAQRESAFKRIEWYEGVLNQLRSGYDYCVINNYKTDSAYSLQYCANRLGIEMEKILRVGSSPYGDIAEIQEKSLLGFKSTSFKRDIDRLTQNILDNYE